MIKLAVVVEKYKYIDFDLMIKLFDNQKLINILKNNHIYFLFTYDKYSNEDVKTLYCINKKCIDYLNKSIGLYTYKNYEVNNNGIEIDIYFELSSDYDSFLENFILPTKLEYS